MYLNMGDRALDGQFNGIANMNSSKQYVPWFGCDNDFLSPVYVFFFFENEYKLDSPLARVF